MPIILATQEAESRRNAVQSQPRQIVPLDPIEKTFTKIRLVEWLKVKAMSSSPSTDKNKNKWIKDLKKHNMRQIL
jgi:hypothetical protein